MIRRIITIRYHAGICGNWWRNFQDSNAIVQILNANIGIHVLQKKKTQESGSSFRNYYYMLEGICLVYFSKEQRKKSAHDAVSSKTESASLITKSSQRPWIKSATRIEGKEGGKKNRGEQTPKRWNAFYPLITCFRIRALSDDKIKVEHGIDRHDPVSTIDTR